MNERIRQLMEQAGGEFYNGFLGSPNSIKFTEEDFEKFADLIVKEIENLSFCSTGYITSDGEDAIRELIRDHFRVEE